MLSDESKTKLLVYIKSLVSFVLLTQFLLQFKMIFLILVSEQLSSHYLNNTFIFLQKIFVMPNMDDIWLPIMHSAMDTRSNANLVTVTDDASKDPELQESEVSDVKSAFQHVQ